MLDGQQHWGMCMSGLPRKDGPSAVVAEALLGPASKPSSDTARRYPEYAAAGGKQYRRVLQTDLNKDKLSDLA